MIYVRKPVEVQAVQYLGNTKEVLSKMRWEIGWGKFEVVGEDLYVRHSYLGRSIIEYGEYVVRNLDRPNEVYIMTEKDFEKEFKIPYHLEY